MEVPRSLEELKEKNRVSLIEEEISNNIKRTLTLGGQFFLDFLKYQNLDEFYKDLGSRVESFILNCVKKSKDKDPEFYLDIIKKNYKITLDWVILRPNQENNPEIFQKWFRAYLEA